MAKKIIAILHNFFLLNWPYVYCTWPRLTHDWPGSQVTEENIAIILQKQAYAKTWSGMEPWSGVFFGVAFLQNKSCVLIPESADASKWNTKSSYCENERLQVKAFTKKACLTVSNSFKWTAYVGIYFVWFDALPPSQQFFSHVWMGLTGLTSTKQLSLIDKSSFGLKYSFISNWHPVIHCFYLNAFYLALLSDWCHAHA